MLGAPERIGINDAFGRKVRSHVRHHPLLLHQGFRELTDEEKLASAPKSPFGSSHGADTWAAGNMAEVLLGKGDYADAIKHFRTDHSATMPYLAAVHEQMRDKNPMLAMKFATQMQKAGLAMAAEQTAQAPAQDPPSPPTPPVTQAPTPPTTPAPTEPPPAPSPEPTPDPTRPPETTQPDAAPQPVPTPTSAQAPAPEPPKPEPAPQPEPILPTSPAPQPRESKPAPVLPESSPTAQPNQAAQQPTNEAGKPPLPSPINKPIDPQALYEQLGYRHDGSGDYGNAIKHPLDAIRAKQAATKATRAGWSARPHGRWPYLSAPALMSARRGEMRSLLLVFAGASVASVAVLIGWIASTGCPPNRLILSASLPAHLSAEVFVHDQRIWSGSRNATEEIAFPMGTGEGQFLVRISNGVEVSIGYVEKADGQDHLLFPSEDQVSYGSLNRGTAEFLQECRLPWSMTG